MLRSHVAFGPGQHSKSRDDGMFSVVCRRISEKSSIEPVLSFENHCSRSNQKRMADHCKRIFGDKLLRDPIEEHPLQEGKELPSPNQLKYKIIIKNKRLNLEDERRALV